MRTNISNILIMIVIASFIMGGAYSSTTCKMKCSGKMDEIHALMMDDVSQLYITPDCCCSAKKQLCINNNPVNSYIFNVPTVYFNKDKLKDHTAKQYCSFKNIYSMINICITGIDFNRYARIFIHARPIYLQNSVLIC
jgi:hypothetical protein